MLHACDDLIVVDKSSGLLVHRGWADDEDVLVERARARFGAVFPVHRLDRGTSGVIVLARSSEAARRLHDAFEASEVEKRYVALVRGGLPAPVRVDRPLPRREDGPRVPAATWIVPLAAVTLAGATLREKRYSLVVARPETGRLHQVRRHSKSSGHPIIGDANYGKSEHNRLLAERVGLARLALHALSLALRHPRTGERMVFHAPLPADLRLPLDALGFDVEALVTRALEEDLFASAAPARS